MMETIGQTAGQIWNYLNENGETSVKDIYAGGDVAPRGESTAINAMGAGKVAAKAIIEALCTVKA